MIYGFKKRLFNLVIFCVYFFRLNVFFKKEIHLFLLERVAEREAREMSIFVLPVNILNGCNSQLRWSKPGSQELLLSFPYEYRDPRIWAIFLHFLRPSIGSWIGIRIAGMQMSIGTLELQAED